MGKWHDSSNQVRVNLTKCLGKLFVKKLKAGEGIDFLVKMNNRNCEDVWRSVFEANEVSKTIADHCD